MVTASLERVMETGWQEMAAGIANPETAARIVIQETEAAPAACEAAWKEDDFLSARERKQRPVTSHGRGASWSHLN